MIRLDLACVTVSGWTVPGPDTLNFDGIFVGLTRAKAMRNSILLSAIVGFFGVFWLFQDWQNNGLWLAMSCFMLMRGVTLIVKYQQLKANNQLLN